MDFLQDVPEDIRMVAALLVSELTSNVLQHAKTNFSLCADITQFAVRVEVADGTTDPPVLKDPGPSDVSGRGILLVSQLSDQWGTQPIPDGKLIWFELSLVEPEQLGEASDLEDPPHKG